jgi:hypothetical protein
MEPTNVALISRARRNFHSSLCDTVLSISDGIATNADASQVTSRFLALEIAQALGATEKSKPAGQNLGTNFEKCVEQFLIAVFSELRDFRPGSWSIFQVGSRKGMEIAQFSQYGHLKEIASVLTQNRALAASLGNDYSISPDIIVARDLVTDEQFNARSPLVDTTSALAADLRAGPEKLPLLHASVSTKWTLRSDRAQNARSEALNLIRNRKGRTPHIVLVTGEPTPSRLASIALGTGDMDCIYHIALYELVEAAQKLGNDEVLSMLGILIDGKRLKDVSDLPLDLAT